LELRNVNHRCDDQCCVGEYALAYDKEWGGLLLHDKVAIITGCYRGFGKAIAKCFLQEGACVAICDLVSVDALQTAIPSTNSHTGRIRYFQTDVSHEDEVSALVAATVAEYQRIDILVNNVGIAGPTEDCWNITLDEWNHTLAVNLGSPFLCSKAVLPHMIRQRAGRIINISSITGKYPKAHRTPYTTTKMGVIGFTRALATDVGQYSITVNAICPGNPGGRRNQEVAHALATYHQHSFNAQKYQRDLATTRRHGILAGQYRHSEGYVNALIAHRDVATLAVFLASDAAQHITGQDINICSGAVMW
jgi:NAD(P)-dependent dehydrogenase (short-subunit alcohol dehydrogenase family)